MKFTVGIVDDQNCDLHEQIEHDHQESSERTKAIRKKFKDNGIFDKCLKIKSAPVKSTDLLTVHTRVHVQKIIDSCRNHEKFEIIPGDIGVTGEKSLISACAAVGSVYAAVNAVLDDKNKINKVFCNVRPPGHHACDSNPAGFCLFNNVALGTMRALENENIRKVLIFDWDLHHGDGTQKIFYDNPNVMYCSFHRAAPFYPNNGLVSQTGNHNNIINVPQLPGETAEEYLESFDTYFYPRAEQFNPDLIFISCGFDSHKCDLYKALPLDYEHFEYMTHRLCELAHNKCKGRLISVLEGGYFPNIISKCALVHVNAMLENNKLYGY